MDVSCSLQKIRPFFFLWEVSTLFLLTESSIFRVNSYWVYPASGRKVFWSSNIPPYRLRQRATKKKRNSSRITDQKSTFEVSKNMDCFWYLLIKALFEIFFYQNKSACQPGQNEKKVFFLRYLHPSIWPTKALTCLNVPQIKIIHLKK